MRAIITIVVLFFISSMIFGQDIIIMNDKSELKVKVVEMGIDEIKYRKFENLEGPVYVINKKEVFMIQYENGQREYMSVESTTKDAVEDTSSVSEEGNFMQPGSATIYFYRPKKFYGKSGDIIIVPVLGIIEDIPSIKNGKYYVLRTSTIGVISFIYSYFFNISPDPLIITIEDGKEYYLRCGVETTGPFLLEVDENEANIEIAELKEMKGKKKKK